MKLKPSALRTPDLARKIPKKYEGKVDKFTLFQTSEEIFKINSIPKENTPDNKSYKRLGNSVHFYNLVSNKKKLVCQKSINKLVLIVNFAFICLTNLVYAFVHI